MEKFRLTANGFNFVYERKLEANETVIVRMPVVSSNRRSINDIGWQSDGDVTLYGTLSAFPERDTALWQKIRESDDVNKTVSAIKVVNNGPACSVIIRTILC